MRDLLITYIVEHSIKMRQDLEQLTDARLLALYNTTRDILASIAAV
jgi:hypothetical protein